MLGERARARVLPIGCRRPDRTRRAEEDIFGAEEAGDVWRRRLAKEFRRLTRLKHASFVEKNGNVADETGLAEIVGDMKHGEAVLEVHGTHFAAHRGAVAGIQGGERL